MDDDTLHKLVYNRCGQVPGKVVKIVDLLSSLRKYLLYHSEGEARRILLGGKSSMKRKILRYAQNDKSRLCRSRVGVV